MEEEEGHESSAAVRWGRCRARWGGVRREIGRSVLFVVHWGSCFQDNFHFLPSW